MNVLLLDPNAIDRYCSLLKARRAESVPELSAELREAAGPQTVADIAVLPIHGVIDYRPSILSEWGYACSTMQRRAQFNALVAEPSISKIILDIDSPGGLYSGTPEFAADIYKAREVKPVIAVANPGAASGALWLGTAASKFFVLGSGDAGSLGALMLHEDASQYFSGQGIKHEILRSPEQKANFNSLEPLTEESRAQHQAEVEQIAEEFLAAVAKYRGVDVRRAAKDFGQGRMLRAKAAVDAGLADGMVTSIGDVIGRRVKSTTRTKLQSAELEEARERREKRESEAMEVLG